MVVDASARKALGVVAAVVVLAGCSSSTNSGSATRRVETVAGGDQLKEPSALAVDGHGGLIVADRGDNRVLRISRAEAITTLAGTGTAGFGGDNGPAATAVLNAPAGVAVGPHGDVFVADQLNNRVRRIDARGLITTVAGNGQRGYAGDGGAATDAVLNAPRAVAADKDGRLFVADGTRIRRVDADGRIATVAGGGSTRLRKDAPFKATGVELGTPEAIALDGNGNLFAAVPMDNWVLRVDRAGEITVVAGDRDGAVDDSDGPAAIAALRAPSGLATDSHGNLFITESDGGRIRRVDDKGGIHTVAQGGDTSLDRPTAIAVGPSGALLVAEPSHDRIVRLPGGTTAVVPPPKPVVTGISPSRGGDAGAASIVIRGSGFSPIGGTSVTFGGQAARVLHAAPQSLLVSSPPLPVGRTVDVVVSTRAGRSSPSVATRFTSERGWAPAGALASPRLLHSATGLDSGEVLVAGGSEALCTTCSPLASAEVYDPATGQWRPTGSMGHARLEHTATRLPDGHVLVAGGKGKTEDIATTGLTSAELYDPASGAWSTTGSMAQGRQDQTATLLGTGRVLVTGGFSLLDLPLGSAEAYDPATGAFFPTGPLAEPRGSHTATLLADGRVLVAGGLGGVEGEPSHPLTSAELYDPATGTWTRAGDMAVARYAHTATLLPGGDVLVVGGLGAQPAYLQSAEIFNPATGRWRPTALPISARAAHVAALLPSGSVLVAGGSPPFVDSRARLASLAAAELYDPAADKWTPTRILNTARGSAPATVLSSPACQAASPPRWCGAVLVAGGAGTNDSPEPLDSPRPLASTELYR